MAFRRGPIMLLLVAGCGVAAPPGPSRQPDAPAVDPAAAAPVQEAPDPTQVIKPGLAILGIQQAFEDPTSMEERLSSRYFMGRWVATAEGYQQEDLPPSAGMSFRRYTGAALGKPGGLAPSHYRVEAEVQAFEQAGHGPEDIPGAPVGGLGIIPYYRDTTHFVLAVATPTEAQLWMVDGLRPGDEWDAAVHRRWLTTLPTPVKVGDPIKWATEIDTKAQTIKLYLNGELRENLTDPFLQDVDHSVALLSNGNYVRYNSLSLKPL